MRLSTRYRTVFAADLAGVLTTLVMVLPFVHLAYRSTPLHATIETASGMIALLAAFLVLGRFRRTARSDDLALATALGFLACANFVFSAMPWALFSEDSMRFSAWTSLIGTVAGAAVLAFASLMPSRRLKRPRQTATAVLTAALLAYAGTAVLVGIFENRLPLGFDPTTSLPPGGVHTVGSHALLWMQLVAAAFFMVAAIGFTRRGERTGDELMTWLAASAALASFARVNYALFSSLYTQWVYVGDALRLGSYLLLLVGDEQGLRALHLPGRQPRQDGWASVSAPFATAVEQLEVYFAGHRTVFDLPLGANGASFDHASGTASPGSHTDRRSATASSRAAWDVPTASARSGTPPVTTRWR